MIITDTANEAKEKYKYLEGLKRHVEPLCEQTRIQEVMTSSLHLLMMGFKQVLGVIDYISPCVIV